MKTITKNLNSLQQLNPASISNSMKPIYRPRYTRTLLPIQKLAYNKVLHGLKAYSDEELKQMTAEDKRSVIYKTNFAWNIINRMKQERLNIFLGNVLQSVFKGELCGNMVPFLLSPITDNHFQINQAIKECVVPMMDIVHEFIKQKLLPSNFLA